MALQDDCILFNRCGSAAQLQNSEIGPDFAIAGAPTYLPGKFDNGVKIDAVTEKVITINTPAQFDFANGALECWLKLDGPITNGDTSEWDEGGHTIFSWYTGSNWLQLFFFGSSFYWNLYDGADRNWTPSPVDMDLPANTLGHFLFVWDRTHLLKRRRIFFNGNEVASNNVLWSDRDMTTATLKLGLYKTDVAPLVGIIDNPKWYQNITDQKILDIIANKDNEYWPIVGGVRLINGGLLQSNMLGGNVLIH